MSANNNLIVVAGAGTGKTYKLVQTCIERLRDGSVGIDEILIVTFTKAAAAELRHRIGDSLQKAFAADPSNGHLARQISLLDRAQISTLHSFCLELVSRHFSDLGLSPRLTTLETAQAAALENEALDTVFENYYSGKTLWHDAAQRVLLQWFKGEASVAREIIRDLHAFTQTRPNPTVWFKAQQALLENPEPAQWRAWHTREIEEWVRRWRPIIEAQPTIGNPARAKVLGLMDKLNLAEIAALADSMDRTIWPSKSKGLYRDPVKGLYREAADLAAWISNGENDPLLEDWKLTRLIASAVLNIANDFAQEFANIKRERGLVDFHDLEQFALRLLWDESTNGPTPRAEYWRERFKWIFVDEYQDINSAQDRIIQALARPVESGNRFLVGDVKQSIYGFRQAEPQIFQAYSDAWGKNEGGQREFLQKNWRSHERILDFVNNLFTGIMSQEVGGVIYDQNARLAFADDENRANLSAKADPAPKVEVHIVTPEQDEAEEDSDTSNPLAELDKAEAEAEVIAQLCRRIVEEEPITLPTGRKAEYGDIVILMRAIASEVEAFAKVFARRGIPFDARRTGFFSCIEILDLQSLLTILDNPLQDIPLLGVLRSPLGCFTLEELADVRIAQGRGHIWDALKIYAKSEKGAKARSFLERFARWRKLARHTSLAERLELILEESGYEAWAAAQDRGEQRRANVRRLVQLARQFDEMHGEGLYPFLKYVEEQLKAVGDIAPASAGSRGAVRLMTVHQSKGLQFPIVIAAGLSKRFNKRDYQGLFLLDDEFGLCMKARVPGKRRQYSTLSYWMARQRQEKRVLDEEMRILYVALTRAEHRMLLVGSPRKTREKAREEWAKGKRPTAAQTTLDWIGPWLGANSPQFLADDGGAAADWTWQWHISLGRTGVSAVPLDVSSSETVSPEKVADLKARIEWKYPFAAETLQEAKSSATALRRDLADEPELARPILFTKPPKQKRGGLRANELGQAAHTLMQHARFESFATEQTLTAEIERLEKAGILTDAEAAAIDRAKILAFWQSNFGKELLQRSGSLRRELTFTAKFNCEDLREVGAPIENDFGLEEYIVVQGAADLVAILPDELWLVDFKTDRIPEKLLDARLKEYALQLRIYAHALSRIYKRPVKRACLYFLEFARTEWIIS